MVGQNIGKYRVLDRIGRGGMGTVYRAIDETLHREVAIKVLNTELNDPAVAKRFRAEAITVARLNHPGIATVYELFQHEGQWLMVMEFVRGETLEALVIRKGPLSAEEAGDLCMQTLAALAHAHSLGVVHRDLKPANIMVAESGVVKIMDFGIARVVGTEHLTSAGFMMGTPAYMAPEQVMGQDIDARADLYAMGVVLFYLCTAKLPFKGSTPFEMAQSRLRDQPMPVRSLRAEMPEWLDVVLATSLEREPARRFQSAPAFREALRRGLANLPLDTPAATSLPPEIVATAAPGSMPVPVMTPATESGRTGQTGGSTEVPQVSVPVPNTASQPAPPAESMTVMAPPKASPGPEGPSAASGAPPVTPSGARATSGRGSSIGLVAAAVIVVVAGAAGWMWWRSREASLQPPTVAESTAPGPVENAAPAPTTETAPPASVPPAPVESGPPSAPPTPVAAVPPGATPTASPATSAPTPSRSAPPPARGAADPAGRGRGPTSGPTVDDSPVTFKDLRALVISGKKADDRPAVLNFGGGLVSASIEQSGGTLVVALPYREINYAYYTRAKDPKWSVVLASPPPDVDLPGGVFRSARRWLTLQSRTAFLIVRLNDADWQRVIDAVGARTGVQVERAAGGQ